MIKLDWAEAYRIIHSRYPFVGIFDAVADPADLDAVAAIEARTNPRVRDELGDLSLVPKLDRVSGPGTTPIMAAFTHARPSRFGNGSFGIYYAARKRETAIAETTYHAARLYAFTKEASSDVDMRVYVSRVRGSFDDLRSLPATDRRLDCDSYDASQRYGAKLHAANRTDGIVYPSVRDEKRRACVACFRPRSITQCRTQGYLTYRWDGDRQQIVAVTAREFLSGFGPTPD